MLVLITGASSGFGKLTVPLLLERGHLVVAGLRGGDSRLQSLFAEERRRYPGKLHGLDLHLESSESLEAAARFVEERFEGRLDVLVNNAGFGLMGVLEDQSEEQIRAQMEINFFGTVFLTRRLLPALRKARGKILNVSSIAGMAGFPFYASYNASKFALEGFMEALKFDLQPFGVRVAMVEPGGFNTGFTTARQFGERSGDPASPYFRRTQAFARVFEETSRHRLGDPARVARLIVRLSEAGNPPFRNWIGKDAAVVRILRALLPERLRFALVAKVFNAALGRQSASPDG